MSEYREISVYTAGELETIKVLSPVIQKSVSLTNAVQFKDVFKEWINGLSGDANTGFVSSCSNIWGLSFAKAVFRLYDTEEDNEEVIKHPILDILKRPFPGMTPAQMKYRISDDLIYEGNSYWLKVRDKSAFGTPRFIYPLYADRITTYPHGRDTIEYYEYNTGGNIIRLEVQDVINIQNFGRSSNIKGIPLVSKIGDTIAVEKLQLAYRRQLYEKGGFLGPVFSTAKVMGDNEFKRAYDMLEAKYGGSANNFRFGLFDNDLKPIPTAYSPKDMQILDDRTLNRDEICAAFGVNKLLFGLSENIQRGNAETVYYVFYSTIIDPLLDHIDQSLTMAFESDFTFNGSYPYEIKHDKLAQRDVETDVKYFTEMGNAGFILPSEVREAEGYEANPLLDEIWIERMRKQSEKPAKEPAVN